MARWRILCLVLLLLGAQAIIVTASGADTIAWQGSDDPAAPYPDEQPIIGHAVSIDAPPGYPPSSVVSARLREEATTFDFEFPAGKDGSKFDGYTVTGICVYRHPTTGEYLPCSGMLVQVLYRTLGTWGYYWNDYGDIHAAADGSWSIQCWYGDYYKLRFMCQNVAAKDWDEWKYYESDEFALAGTTEFLDLGYLVANRAGFDQETHLLTNILRNRQVVEILTGDVIPQVTVSFEYPTRPQHPDFTSTDEIWFNWDDCLDDGRVAAQYARIWMALYGGNWEDDCGGEELCRTWCYGDPQTAVTQGLSLWLSNAITKRYTTVSTYTAANPYDFEDLQHCVFDYSARPDSTAGFFAAVLRDIQDDHQDIHTDYGSVYRDALSLGHEEILTAARSFAHPDPLHFLLWLRDANPSIRADLWQTAKNCGFDTDDEPPGTITGRTSSHTVGVPSPDATITLDWTPPVDLDSGIGGYSVAAATRILAPDEIQDIGAVTTWTSAALAPGDWYVTVRTVDRAGLWSAGYVTLGPYTVSEPGPAELLPYARAGWAYPVVPRPTADAGANSCPSPTTLVDGALVYLSTCGTNAGTGTADRFGVQFLLDGVLLGSSYAAGPVDMGEDYWILNKSTHVSGGRHTLGAFHDRAEIIAEPNEGNNRWSSQWIWQPTVLSPGTVLSEAAPPDPEGGWDALPVGADPQSNCNGYRITSADDWRAVFLRALDDEDDYDLALYAPSTGPTSGFGSWIAPSRREAGELEAVVVNGREAGGANWDVGVINSGRIDGAGDYELSVLSATTFAFDDSLTVTQAQDELMLLYEVEDTEEGWVTVTVDVRPADQKVRWYWFDGAFTTGALLDRTMLATSDASGRARRSVQVSQSGYCGLIVARDPADGTAPDTLTIEVEPGLANLRPLSASGWYSPLVPRPAQDGTPQLVALPDTLHGNAASTWFNAAIRNDSVIPVATARRDILIDGVKVLGVQSSGLAAYTDALDCLQDAYTVRGGRHTLSLHCDAEQKLDELVETDNDFGEQYVWSPLPLVCGAPVTRPAPPDPYGGWQDVVQDSTRWFNCDGLRLPVPAGRFGAVAVMPGDSCNVDAFLHQPRPGARDGFGESLCQSQWGPGRSDYVLVNFALADIHPYDVGLVNFGGDLDCTVEAVSSVPLDGGLVGAHGPYTLPGGRLLDLYEVSLTAGYLSIALENVAGGVDWGVSLHPADAPFLAKSVTVDSMSAYQAAPGSDETLLVEVPADGWYCLAVWKATAGDLALSGDYRLTLSFITTDVPDGPPRPAAPSGLVGIQPNPFNPRTTLLLEVARSGPVRLDVFDTRGRRVRVLVAADLPAGRHEIEWDGRDDAGSALASGIYFARYTADSVPQTRKLTLVQ